MACRETLFYSHQQCQSEISAPYKGYNFCHELKLNKELYKIIKKIGKRVKGVHESLYVCTVQRILFVTTDPKSGILCLMVCNNDELKHI